MIWTGKLIKRNGTLKYVNGSQENSYKKWINNITENSIVEVIMEYSEGNVGTIPQLKKLHALIRELASFTGTSVGDMKLMVKDAAGFCSVRSIEGKEYIDCRSFGDMNTTELGLAIETCFEIGRKVNLILN